MYKYKVDDSNIGYIFESFHEKKYGAELAEEAAYNYYVENNNKTGNWPKIIHLYLNEECEFIGSFTVHLDFDPSFYAEFSSERIK